MKLISETITASASNLFIFFEPLREWLSIDVTARRSAEDWAIQIKKLVDEDYPEAKKIRLVMDNLNTHTGEFLYKVFEPIEARRLLDKLEFNLSGLKKAIKLVSRSG